jgi:hypothetical protein
MTIKEYLHNQPARTCADWVKKITADNLGAYESQILAAADALGLIQVNQAADFIKAINK